MATMRDVAERAGVSIATVSFVVNETKNVAPETKQRVVAAMADLGFRRNALARALATRRTRNIALLFPALEHRLGRTALLMVTSAARSAADRGYNLMLWPISNDAANLHDYVGSGLVDGVLLMEVQVEDARVERLKQLEIPFGLIGRTADPSNFDYIDMDFDATVHVGIDYLRSLGHRRIALVTEEIDSPTLVGYGPIVRTEAAYRERMVAEHEAVIIEHTSQSPSSGREAARRLLAHHPDVTAIMVMNEEAAFGLLNGTRDAGFAVPGDVSVLSIATTAEMGGIAEPALSTLVAPGVEMGCGAVGALIDRLEGVRTELMHTLIPCRLEIAASTGPAAERLEHRL
jgi:DNA-binding LacI/PurR family transcriptional regulator